QTVPDGFGGTEPRMTFNAYLAQQRKAWDVLSDFCSAMRCMPVSDCRPRYHYTCVFPGHSLTAPG
ncbi:hypothetical protein EWK54_26700, partial [Escherichia coli]